MAGQEQAPKLLDQVHRWVDRAGADGLTGRHEIVRSSGSPGTDGSWPLYGTRERLALLARAGPERHFDGAGLAGAVAGGGAETALEGVRRHWVLLVLGERRAGLYDGQQQRGGLGVLPGRQHRKEGLGTFVSLRAGPQELRGRAVRDADRAGRAGLYVQPKGGLVLPRCGEGDGGLVEAAEPGARPGDTDVGMRQLGPGRRGVGGGEYGERRGGAGPEVGQRGDRKSTCLNS